MPRELPDWILTQHRALGRRVQQHRLRSNLTQEGLAERAGIDRSTVQRIEAGTSDPKLSHLLRIADALEIPLADLFG